MSSAPLPHAHYRSAIVVGGTGLVGNQIVQQLLAHTGYDRVTTLLRRKSGLHHPKLIEHVIEFENPEKWAPLIQGDVLFSALGTTLKTAGSKAAQFKVDHDYQLWAARSAAHNSVAHYVLVSAAGASASSPLFYPRMKGLLEREVAELGFASCNLLRPGILDGDRTEHRPGERWALEILRHTPRWLLPASAQPNPVALVAQVCIRADWEAHPGTRVIEAAEILESPMLPVVKSAATDDAS